MRSNPDDRDTVTGTERDVASGDEIVTIDTELPPPRRPWVAAFVRQLQIWMPDDDHPGLPAVEDILPLELDAAEESLVRNLLAQVALRIIARQPPGGPPAASRHLLELLKLSADRHAATPQILRTWAAVAGAVAGGRGVAASHTPGLADERVRRAVDFVRRHHENPISACEGWRIMSASRPARCRDGSRERPDRPSGRSCSRFA